MSEPITLAVIRKALEQIRNLPGGIDGRGYSLTVDPRTPLLDGLHLGEQEVDGVRVFIQNQMPVYYSLFDQEFQVELPESCQHCGTPGGGGGDVCCEARRRINELEDHLRGLIHDFEGDGYNMAPSRLILGD